ncbi:MAG: ASKHA domain-containing protein, partial [SAR324 cluster bacterium]|nr:ASKHA domain-containing protein [SAR324 cluster bacterium]
GICGRCQIVQATGEFPKHRINSKAENISPLCETEKAYAERPKKSLAEGRRLSCATKILADCVIDVPPDSQVHQQIIRKDAEAFDIEIIPPVQLHYVEVWEPNMYDPSGDLRRLREALEREWQLKNLRFGPGMLLSLQRELREGNWKVTVAVDYLGQVIAVYPGFRESLCGLAVDIGSTTVAAHLCNLRTGEVLASAGVMNPQIRFGEDLMSRVSYVMMHPGGDLEMTKVIRTAINELAVNVTTQAQRELDEIVEVSFVGNPIMHHLLLGINPVELGGAPFALATDESVRIRARDLDLTLHTNTRCYVLPCIAGHVGADTAGMILSEAPHQREALSLLVDIGTNAEIVLGNNEHLLAASSPTGPAFEGAQISSGQRAAPGAIERVRIDRETLAPRFQVIGSDLWSNESGFEKDTKALSVTGICGSGIIEVIAEMYLAGILSQDGVINGDLAAKSKHIIPDGRTFSYVLSHGKHSIQVTQNDVRAVQLAKAALYAGIRLLMERMEIETVDRIRLAGAFGSHIDVKYAMVLGLIPDCDLEQVSSAGNAAGTGARIALLNYESRKEIEGVVREVEKVETAVESKFQEHFVNAMAFPHKTDSFPNLAKVVELPAETNMYSNADTNLVRKRRRKKR